MKDKELVVAESAAKKEVSIQTRIPEDKIFSMGKKILIFLL